MLTLGLDEANAAPRVLPAEAQGGPSMRPQKRLRPDLAPEEADEVQAHVTEIAARLAGSKAAPAQAEMAEKKKRLRNVGNRGPKKTAEAAMEVGESAAAQGDASGQPPVGIPPPHAMEEAPIAAATTILTPEAEVVIIDEGSPDREEGADIHMAEAEEAEAQAGGEATLEESAESTCRQGKEPAAEGALPTQGLGWPFPYRIDKVEVEKWEQLRMLLMGSSRVGPRYDREPSQDYRYEPKQHLDKRGSVLESRPAQTRAVEQLYLDRDDEILGEIPDVGLHQCLRSYLIRGALVEQEIFDH